MLAPPYKLLASTLQHAEGIQDGVLAGADAAHTFEDGSKKQRLVDENGRATKSKLYASDFEIVAYGTDIIFLKRKAKEEWLWVVPLEYIKEIVSCYVVENVAEADCMGTPKDFKEAVKKLVTHTFYLDATKVEAVLQFNILQQVAKSKYAGDDNAVKKFISGTSPSMVAYLV